MNYKVHEFCNNIPEGEKIRHIICERNLKLIRAFIDSKLCNIYTLDNNSLIIECRDNIEEFKKLQSICNNVEGFKNYKLCFSNTESYKELITV